MIRQYGLVLFIIWGALVIAEFLTLLTLYEVAGLYPAIIGVALIPTGALIAGFTNHAIWAWLALAGALAYIDRIYHQRFHANPERPKGAKHDSRSRAANKHVPDVRAPASPDDPRLLRPDASSRR